MLKIVTIALALVCMASVINAIDVNALLKAMSLEEKCGQMNEITFAVIQKNPPSLDPDDDQIDKDKLKLAVEFYHVGGIHNTPLDTAQKASTWQKIQRKIQDAAMKGTHKIPILYAIESIHGTNYLREGTLFPQAIGTASTFNLGRDQSHGHAMELQPGVGRGSSASLVAFVGDLRRGFLVGHKDGRGVRQGSPGQGQRLEESKQYRCVYQALHWILCSVEWSRQNARLDPRDHVERALFAAV
jgi:hypothetical protein